MATEIGKIKLTILTFGLREKPNFHIFSEFPPWSAVDLSNKKDLWDTLSPFYLCLRKKIQFATEFFLKA